MLGVNTFVIDLHLAEMRAAIADMDDPAEAFFYKAHLQGMEQLAVLQQQWDVAVQADKPGLACQITALRTKLMESLEVLKPKGAV